MTCEDALWQFGRFEDMKEDLRLTLKAKNTMCLWYSPGKYILFLVEFPYRSVILFICHTACSLTSSYFGHCFWIVFSYDDAIPLKFDYALRNPTLDCTRICVVLANERHSLLKLFLCCWNSLIFFFFEYVIYIQQKELLWVRANALLGHSKVKVIRFLWWGFIMRISSHLFSFCRL